jgi:hypothetical protein
MFNYILGTNNVCVQIVIAKGSHLVATETYAGAAKGRIFFFENFVANLQTAMHQKWSNC